MNEPANPRHLAGIAPVRVCGPALDRRVQQIAQDPHLDSPVLALEELLKDVRAQQISSSHTLCTVLNLIWQERHTAPAKRLLRCLVLGGTKDRGQVQLEIRSSGPPLIRVIAGERWSPDRAAGVKAVLGELYITHEPLLRVEMVTPDPGLAGRLRSPRSV